MQVVYPETYSAFKRERSGNKASANLLSSAIYHPTTRSQSRPDPQSTASRLLSDPPPEDTAGGGELLAGGKCKWRPRSRSTNPNAPINRSRCSGSDNLDRGWSKRSLLALGFLPQDSLGNPGPSRSSRCYSPFMTCISSYSALNAGVPH